MLKRLSKHKNEIKIGFQPKTAREQIKRIQLQSKEIVMNKASESKNVICFGEVLWDILPASAKPGGAPMNVAYHLNKLNVQAHLISRIGQDEPGEKLRNLLTEWGLPVNFCGTDSAYPTSEVHARVNANHEVSYEILFPVAWDFIPYQNSYSKLLTSADALVFGSLVTRNETSRATLFRLLKESRYNVFDVNLRAPHYAPEPIAHMLHATNLLKLNEHELVLITNWFSSSCSSEGDRIQLLQEKFDIPEIIVTKGSRGATFYKPQAQLECIAFKVEVADTVGSGDAFLAAFLAKRLQGNAAAVALSYAAALGGFVTQNHGACPDYTLSELEAFKQSHEANTVTSPDALVQVL